MSKEAIIVKNKKGETVATLDSTGVSKIYGSARITPALAVGYPTWGTRPAIDMAEIADKAYLNAEHIVAGVTNSVNKMNVCITESVTVLLERYEDVILEVNSDNEVVIKVGKLKIGGCK